jgi:hypothetical protein
MSEKKVETLGNLLQDYNTPLNLLAEDREPFDAEAMSNMMFQGFEQNINELAERGIELPAPTGIDGRVFADYQGPMTRTAGNNGGSQRVGSAMPVSKAEQAVVSLMEIREDMLRQYASVSREPMMAVTAAMNIQKLEAQIISMGGEIERFDPEKYQSGLKPVEQAVDPMEVAKKVVENTKQAYNLREIKKIWAGTSKNGKAGVCICIANAPGFIVQGTVIPKNGFTGNEVIDYVPSSTGKGSMLVKSASNGYWNDVSKNFDIVWQVTPEEAPKEAPQQ